MTRLTRMVFTDLAIWMIGLGMLMGLIFPFFVALMGVPPAYVLTPWFFAATLSAGFVVGAVNIGLARNVVGQRLHLLADRMQHVRTSLDQISADGDLTRCQPAECAVPVDSDDELGQSAAAFNHLVQSLFGSLHAQAGVRAFTEMLTGLLELNILVEKLDLFRQGLALALHNAIIHDRLQRLAAIDPLTSVYNRRFGLERLHEEFGRAVRASSPLGILMFDLDRFKTVNDSYGHLVGDRMLALAAKTARLVIREGDILVRYGGEEFLVILPAASKADAAKIAERLRRLVEDTSLLEQQQSIRVTVSIGCTAYPELEVTTAADLVSAADKALYSAKALGRNQVVAA